MSRHLGATYTTSVLIVIACAIAFHRADVPPRRVDKSIARGGPSEPKRSPTPGTVPPVEPSVAVRSEGPPSRDGGTSPPRPESAPRPAAPADPPKTVVAETVARQVARPRIGPRGAFTRVEDDESLADVARRVYGSVAKAGDLWRANRDQLPTPESPLRGGMRLRTP